ncbi:MAG: hypothetical protein ACOC44_01275 [Promethearchaeia archaeon]
MREKETRFQEIKDKKVMAEINDFIINISENVEEEDLSYAMYFIENLNDEEQKRININLVFLIGELLKEGYKNKSLRDYLISSYYKSDVWIRREILNAIHKLGEFNDLSDFWYRVLQSALREKDKTIRETALEAVIYLVDLSEKVFKTLLYTVNQASKKEMELINEVFSTHIRTEEKLFSLLDTNQNYKTLNKKGTRILLMSCFESVIQLEPFRKKIRNSEWTEKWRRMFLEEIDIMEKILLKNI